MFDPFATIGPGATANAPLSTASPPQEKPGRRRPEQRGGGPDWPAISDAALRDENLPRVVAFLGLRRIATLTRGELAWWRPEYVSHRPWRAAMGDRSDRQAAGWRAGAWDADNIKRADREDAERRDAIAARNRALRDGAVLMLARGSVPPGHAAELGLEADYRFIATARAVEMRFDLRAALDAWKAALVPPGPPGARDLLLFLDLGTGAWRTKSGTLRGDDVIGLAAAISGLSYGRAGWRLARLCGLSRLPMAPGGGHG